MGSRSDMRGAAMGGAVAGSRCGAVRFVRLRYVRSACLVEDGKGWVGNV